MQASLLSGLKDRNYGRQKYIAGSACLPSGLNKIKFIKFKNVENVPLYKNTLRNLVLHRHKLVFYTTHVLCLILTTHNFGSK